MATARRSMLPPRPPRLASPTPDAREAATTQILAQHRALWLPGGTVFRTTGMVSLVFIFFFLLMMMQNPCYTMISIMEIVSRRRIKGMILFHHNRDLLLSVSHPCPSTTLKLQRRLVAKTTGIFS
ncbi:hypothetical protein E2C01_092919 [Portunus trituberculatus]|uniref:Uncharacterized protein n=1 Tax=Portunus trituberculatus TaxID=210409 RepID=A0A5B7JLJ5_PORTR|nr:hypothetical protein [Portunus trituberculatus]